MDTASAVVQLISTVGFPIVMCGVMGYYVKYLNDTYKEEINKINDGHKDEVNNLTTTIENNTIVMEKLSAKIDTILDLKGSDGNV